jgi:arylsulfatase
MEGRSLAPGFAGDRRAERVLIWEHYGNAAVRQGKWKLVRLHGKAPGGVAGDGWELYDIEKDRSELHDLARVHPDKAAELAELWTRHAHRTMVFPQPGGKKD